MVEKNLFAGPGFALSLAHIMRGGGAEAQTFFPQALLAGAIPREKGALREQHSRDGHHQPALAMLPPRCGSPGASRFLNRLVQVKF